MTWATVEDMLGRFNRADNPELDQLTAAAGSEVDEDAVQAALDEAEAIINGYLSGRSVTVADNANLKRIQMDIARWTLYRDAVPDRVQQIYQADIDQLKSIRSREQSIGDDAGSGSTAEMAAISADYYRGF